MTESKKMDWSKVAETLRHERMLRPYADEYGAHADAALDLVERMARGELVERPPALPPREEAARAVVHVEKAAEPEHIVAWTNDLERKEAALAQAAALLKAYAAGELVERAAAVEAYKRTLAPPADEATVDELEHCERVSQELFLIPVPQRVSIIARERAAAVEAYKRTLAPVANIRAALNTFATTKEAEVFVQEQVAAADRVGYERGRAEHAWRPAPGLGDICQTCGTDDASDACEPLPSVLKAQLQTTRAVLSKLVEAARAYVEHVDKIGEVMDVRPADSSDTEPYGRLRAAIESARESLEGT